METIEPILGIGLNNSNKCGVLLGWSPDKPRETRLLVVSLQD